MAQRWSERSAPSTASVPLEPEDTGQEGAELGLDGLDGPHGRTSTARCALADSTISPLGRGSIRRHQTRDPVHAWSS